MHRFSNLGRKEQQRLIKEDGRGKEENRTMKNFEGLLEQIKSCSKKKLAVAVAQDDAVLEAVKAARIKISRMRFWSEMLIRSRKSLQAWI